ncbi:DNA polymerase interacting tetratricopeptide repeat-containing, protein of 47 kDa [Chrysoperla carnea]|uniref:DNA polymerase interacting tetratricopeptide repeat-containing, protein of 47 kDa n=1 Tax=Chrysoperla carnea TaxID=189513 RepID=UPI001D06FCF3|nr:DNA polymerase interacting tetratricopeptide repeat-containing, protein of 47 kDa [Chrysoperla carnea]
MDDNKSASTSKSQPMTEEERLKLAEKLDAELDEFINGLEKKPYTDGWTEENWQEEFEKHPFFMKNAPTGNEELSPLMEGLQKLKYDPEENTPAELAQAYKEDGNFNFKYKKYRLAILAYTEGLRAKSGNDEIDSTLYNNRAACHYFLQNYRSSLRDCQQALKLKPGYTKAIIRAANCAYKINQYDRCIEYCDEILLGAPENKEILDLRHKAISDKKLFERDIRKKQALEKSRKLEETKLLNEIEKRGFKIESTKGTKIFNLAELEPTFPEIAQHRVYINNEDNLVWPVILLYPEFKTMDFIQEFNETSTFEDHLSEILIIPPEWDYDRKYHLNNIRIYFENKAKQKMIHVDLKKTLKAVLLHKEYIITGGVPSFLIFVKDSPAEKKYLENN